MTAPSCCVAVLDHAITVALRSRSAGRAYELWPRAKSGDAVLCNQRLFPVRPARWEWPLKRGQTQAEAPRKALETSRCLGLGCLNGNRGPAGAFPSLGKSGEDR